MTDRAFSDLQQSREYIRQRAPEAADRWYRGILTALLHLEQHPEVSPLAPENAEFDIELRQLLVRTKSRLASRALFTIVGNQVHVLSIRRPDLPLVTKRDLE